MIKKIFLMTVFIPLWAIEQKKEKNPHYSACLSEQTINNLKWKRIYEKPKISIFLNRLSTSNYISATHRHTFYFGDRIEPFVMRQKITAPCEGILEKATLLEDWLKTYRIVEIFLSFGDSDDPPRKNSHKK